MFLSIVIAIYDEESNVRELTNRIYNSMNSLRLPFELIYVIDGTDSSYDILKEMQKSRNNIVLYHPPNLMGFKKSFLKGFSLVSKKATHILTMDGDLNHRPEEIKTLIDKLNKTNADIVIGSRYVKHGKIQKIPFWKVLISVIANIIMRFLWNIKINDKTSGFRLYKKKVIDNVIPLSKSENFEFLFEILIISKIFKYKIKEVPITLQARVSGQSKYKLWSSAKGYIKLVFRHCFR